MNLIRVLTAALLVTLVAACASFSDLEPPDLTLVGVQPVDATVFESTLRVRLRLTNANPEPLDLEGLSLKLSLDGLKVGRGLMSESVSVSRLASTVISVDFFVNNASLALHLRDVLERQRVTYAVSGKLYLRRASGRKTLKVSNEGELDFGRNATAVEPTGVDS